MNHDNSVKDIDVLVKYKSSEKLSIGTNNRKNFGYAAFISIYHTLEIDKFLINRQRSTKIEANTNHIMKLLVNSRLLDPGSKKKAYDNRDQFFEKTNYSLDDVYRSLNFFNEKGNELQLWINDRIKENYGRDTSRVYYDVTNYYFESDKEDEFRRKGVSKEHRPNPIVQMGLFMDTTCLVTSEYEKSASEIIEIYRGLWKIEESFKVTKSDLESRPVFISTDKHIKAHFLTCFIALVIARILEYKLEGKYSITKIINSLKKCSCTNVDQNYYLFDYYDEVLHDIEIALTVDFSTKIRTLQQIKKNISETKK